jgi:diguanylate cyclase (GGDEF)-like protein/PAS domain S-box-containing protein
MTILEKSQPSYKEILDHLYEGVYCVDREGHITYWNEAAERITGFAAAMVLGSRCSDNILTHIDAQGKKLCLEGCPVTQTMMDGFPREAEVFLHHKGGHRVPVLVRVSPLKDATGAIIGAVELFSDNSARKAIAEHLKELEDLAFLDPLTRLANRRFLQMTLQIRLQELKRYGLTSGVIFLDIDGFKQVNDIYGHKVGDQILVMVGNTLITNSRPFDVIGRWGGEEFVGLLRNVDEKTIYTLVERYRVLLENAYLFTSHGPIRVTASIGATLARVGDNWEKAIERADRLMYVSKQTGKNRVTTDGLRETRHLGITLTDIQCGLSA